MPTTTTTKGAAIPVRPTPQMRRQLDELIEAGFGNQTEIIRTAIDRMYVQEKRTMNSKATEYGDVFGNMATVDELIARFNESEFDTLAKYLEAEAVALHGTEAEGNDYAAMARQIEGELYQRLESEAHEAVINSEAEQGVWFGRENAEQVVFANGVYTTACNGDGTDYTDATKAAEALANEWLRDLTKGR